MIFSPSSDLTTCFYPFNLLFLENQFEKQPIELLLILTSLSKSTLTIKKKFSLYVYGMFRTMSMNYGSICNYSKSWNGPMEDMEALTISRTEFICSSNLAKPTTMYYPHTNLHPSKRHVISRREDRSKLRTYAIRMLKVLTISVPFSNAIHANPGFLISLALFSTWTRSWPEDGVGKASLKQRAWALLGGSSCQGRKFERQAFDHLGLWCFFVEKSPNWAGLWFVGCSAEMVEAARAKGD